jgi:hypothetical protein
MNQKIGLGSDAKLCEEIAELARKYLEDTRCGGIQEIDRIILSAVGDSRWDDVSKWHRVRLRYLRFQQERRAVAQLNGAFAQG